MLNSYFSRAGRRADDVSKRSSPVAILTTARSGSTLLRFIVDSHPGFACPTEAGLGHACLSLARVWHLLSGEPNNSGSLRDPTSTLDLRKFDTESAERIRNAVEQYYLAYLERVKKVRWCDKSLDNLHYAELLHRIFPDMQFICLYRHCMDVIASGVEATPWGVQSYGFENYTAHYPGNSVATIGHYWLDCTRAIQAFERDHSEHCIRIRYEDLVSQPESVAKDIFNFLGADYVPGLTDDCFTVPHGNAGPGDQKIWFTKTVHTDSIGRGVRVPRLLLPPRLLADINNTLEELHYRPVSDDWNRTVRQIDPRADGPGSPFTRNGNTVSGAALEVCELIQARVVQAGSASKFHHDEWAELGGTPVQLTVLSENGSSAGIILNADAGKIPTITHTATGPDNEIDIQSNRQANRAIIADAQTWTALIRGSSNVAVEYINGRLRCTAPESEGKVRPAELELITALLDLQGSRPAESR